MTTVADWVMWLFMIFGSIGVVSVLYWGVHAAHWLAHRDRRPPELRELTDVEYEALKAEWVEKFGRGRPK